MFCLFILNILILCFNKTPRFISWTINKYPRLSYYLTSIGWIPYFAIIIPALLLVSAFFVNYSDKSLSFCVDILHYILELGIPVSLAIAFIRQRFKKISDTPMFKFFCLFYHINGLALAPPIIGWSIGVSTSKKP